MIEFFFIVHLLLPFCKNKTRKNPLFICVLVFCIEVGREIVLDCMVYDTFNLTVPWY